MKILIGNLTLENVVETSTLSHIKVEVSLEKATHVYDALKELGTFNVDFVENDNVCGKYTDKVLKNMEYEDGIAVFNLVDADRIAKQVEQNKADIEYILLMQEI